MRLVCPNCAAQYEVDDSVIPDAGRDVQCSSCGQMWFQPGKAAMIEAARDAETDDDAAPEADGWDIAGAWAEAEEAAPETPPADNLETETPAAEPEEAPVTPPVTPSHPKASGTAQRPAEGADTTTSSVAAMIAAFRAEQAATETEDDDVPPLEPAPRPGAQPRRALDDSLLSILREEAEREARARRTEGTSLETQEELNLAPTDAPEPAKPAATPPAPVAKEPAFDGIFAPEEMPPEEDERVAHYGAYDDLGEPAVQAPGRGERLPDIEEINSTLRAASDRSLGRSGTIIGANEAAERGGFRFGFSSVILAALVALLIYSFSSQISERVPATGPALKSYVALVDHGRVWLDGQLQRAIDLMQESQTAQQ